MSARFLHGWQNFRLASTGIRETLINTILCSTNKRVYKHCGGALHTTVGTTGTVTEQQTPPRSHSWEASGSSSGQVSYGNWRFITIFTTASHLSLPWATSIRSTHSHFISVRIHFRINFHLRQGFAIGLFPLGVFTTETLLVFHYFMRATCPAHLVLLDFIARTHVTKDLIRQH